MKEMVRKVLEEETFKELGYYPDLTASKSRVMAKCVCGKVMECSVRSLFHLCKSCSSKKREQHFKKLKSKMPAKEKKKKITGKRSKKENLGAILVQETLDKYGYNPLELSRYSQKIIIYRCFGCHQIFETKRECYTTGHCYLCSIKYRNNNFNGYKYDPTKEFQKEYKPCKLCGVDVGTGRIDFCPDCEKKYYEIKSQIEHRDELRKIFLNCGGK